MTFTIGREGRGFSVIAGNKAVYAYFVLGVVPDEAFRGPEWHFKQKSPRIY